jgi:hypothetical protein
MNNKFQQELIYANRYWLIQSLFFPTLHSYRSTLLKADRNTFSIRQLTSCETSRLYYSYATSAVSVPTVKGGPQVRSSKCNRLVL